jgi:hypothetical protein
MTQKLFCEGCGVRLRGSPVAREYKEKVRAKKSLVAVDCGEPAKPKS